jgi:hypothetical protein
MHELRIKLYNIYIGKAARQLWIDGCLPDLGPGSLFTLVPLSLKLELHYAIYLVVALAFNYH